MSSTNKIKVLYFVDRMLRGGIQSFLIENIKHMDRSNIDIEFLLLDDGNEYELETELKNLGIKVYKLKGIWIRKPSDYIKYSKAVDKFFKEHHDYKLIHLNASSKNFLILKKAKKYGIKIRIAHSHNIEFQTKNILKRFVGNCFKIPLREYATHYFACSELAGEWLFGKKISKEGKITIIHNAVDVEKFKFDEAKRNKIRKELKIEDKLVFGNVGRFSEQKNHIFLIDIFNEIYRSNNNVALLLVGTGEKEEEIKEKVRKLGIEDVVYFLGFREDVNHLMSAMDVFLLPSLYEGLPVVAVEAQAAGLPSFVSKDVITEEVKITDLIHFISLKNTAEEWKDIILNSNLERKDKTKELIDKGYYINDTSKELENIYLSL